MNEYVKACQDVGDAFAWVAKMIFVLLVLVTLGIASSPVWIIVGVIAGPVWLYRKWRSI
ncbi:MAG: hypothetical protein ACXABY_03715 [Candidatus Thorarchaeota archaeon]|jgi:hypothetical protein